MMRSDPFLVGSNIIAIPMPCSCLYLCSVVVVVVIVVFVAWTTKMVLVNSIRIQN